MEFAALLLGDGEFVQFAGFVVKHLEVNEAASKLEAMHDAVVGGDVVTIVPRFECFKEDYVAIGVIC